VFVTELQPVRLCIVEQLLPNLPLRGKSSKWRIGGHESRASIDIKVVRSEGGGIYDTGRRA